MLQVLDLSDMDPVNRHYVELARKSGDELLGFVNRILEFTSIQSGDLPLADERIDVNEVIGAAAEAYRAAAEGTGLSLHFTPADDLPEHVRSDAGRLTQIVDALVSNAVKFTEDGHVHVRVSRRGGTDDQVTVRIEVFDTGIGIPTGSLDEVFQSFVQADSSTTRTYEGAGLGLSFAEKLVQRMGGQLEVESEEGRGSRFWFSVPLSVGHGPAVDETSQTRVHQSLPL